MLESQLQSSWIKRLKRDLVPVWMMKATVTNLTGAPDLVMCYRGKFIAIEFKILPNKLSPKQEHERNKLIDCFALYLVVDQTTDYSNTLKIINAWGY